MSEELVDKNELKFINIVAPWNDRDAYDTLTTCWSVGFGIEDVTIMMNNLGYKVPERQYVAFCKLQDITHEVFQYGE